MRVRFGEIARREFLEARDWFNRQQEGLGQRFAAEIRTAAARIGRMPLLYPMEIGEVHKCPLQRFPYVLRYILREDTVVILAVSHQHREPDY